jgi:hypothetical protein
VAVSSFHMKSKESGGVLRRREDWGWPSERGAAGGWLSKAGAGSVPRSRDGGGAEAAGQRGVCAVLHGNVVRWRWPVAREGGDADARHGVIRLSGVLCNGPLCLPLAAGGWPHHQLTSLGRTMGARDGRTRLGDGSRRGGGGEVWTEWSRDE